MAKLRWGLIARHVVIGTACLILALMTFSFFGNYSLPSTTISAQVLTPTVAPGDELVVQYTVERERRCHTRIERVFVDSQNQRFVLEDTVLEAGDRLGFHQYKTRYPVPMAMAGGPAILRVSAIFACNAFQRWQPIIAPGLEMQFHVVNVGGGVYRQRQFELELDLRTPLTTRL